MIRKSCLLDPRCYLYTVYTVYTVLFTVYRATSSQAPRHELQPCPSVCCGSAYEATHRCLNLKKSVRVCVGVSPPSSRIESVSALVPMSRCSCCCLSSPKIGNDLRIQPLLDIARKMTWSQTRTCRGVDFTPT